MYYESQVDIKCLGDYIGEITNLNLKKSSNGFHWYRGHLDMEWELIPKVQREFYGSNEEELFRRERYYTNNFQARASTLNLPKPELNENANWLTLMQHYGLPTRLLDWSRSPLIALYFAISDKNRPEKDACVWVLDPSKLNDKQKLEKTSNVKGKTYKNSFIYNMAHNTISTMIYTAFRRWKLSSNPDAITPDDRKFDHRFNTLKGKMAACYPTEADNRVYNQYSAFTVHTSTRKLTDICDDSTLLQIKIPRSSKPKLLKELSVCGITQSYIFPDFEHLAKEIQEQIKK
jgi:hypothetical protein